MQVAPLICGSNVLSLDRLAAAKKGTVIELVYVPEVPEDGDWFADLRVSIPVSKGVLLRQAPQHGFVTPFEAGQFSEMVAAKTRRPAWHDGVHEMLQPSLQQFIDEEIEAKRYWAHAIEQIRLEATQGTRLAPKDLTLWVITYQKPTDEVRRPLRDWRTESKVRSVKKSIGGAKLLAFQFRSVDDMKITDYRNSTPMSLRGLGGGIYW